MRSKKLVDAFLAFRNDCIWLQTIYNTFSDLYQSESHDVTELMDATAPAFFSDLNIILADYFVLQVCRVTDPPATCGHLNLTAFGINDLLQKHRALTPEITSAAEGLLPFRERLIDARNKLGAHADLQAILAGQPLGSHTDVEREAFFSSLYLYVDEVGITLGVGPLDFRSTAAAGDALDLIRCLRAGRQDAKHRS